MGKRIAKIPSWLWIIIFIAGIVLFIVGIQISIYGIATIEGIGTFIMLTAGILISGVFTSKNQPMKSNIVIALFISFYALMGASIDQSGNYIFNKPVEYLCCPGDSKLARNMIIRDPLPERRDFVQDFSCVDENLNRVEEINLLAVFGIRFGEYVLIGYLLLWIRRFRYKYFIEKKFQKQPGTDT
ncbi:MAG TPA: hypothetical protein PK536_01950 [Ignavibacteria bacterium]|nr:hypothetical protein [Bacteroidota bacterium]HRI84189.1 hypothetical protein [Ignavibacteria bacterium]HRJ98342.1 hypothetical protein [Ignavibacteria bacterium]